MEVIFHTHSVPEQKQFLDIRLEINDTHDFRYFIHFYITVVLTDR